MDLNTLRDTPPWDWPDNAGALILEKLTVPCSAQTELCLAVDLAGDLDMMSDPVVEALLKIAGSGGLPDEVRGQAAIALGPALEEADIDGFDDEEPAISKNAFDKVQKVFNQLFFDPGVPTLVRRRVLEASVRCPQEWHAEAIRKAYLDPDEDWRLTAVFSMQYIKGFEAEILESLKSENSDIRYEAVCAAGNWQVSAAWPHVARLLKADDTSKPLLLAAIEASASINPDEAADLIGDYLDSDDEDISEAAMDALSMVEGSAAWDDEEDEDEEDDDDDVGDE